MSFYDDASWLLIPSGIKEDVVYAQKPTSGLGDLSFSRASDATYTDSTGVVRRSPYNLLQQSEMFSDVAWTKSSGGTGIAPSITANTSTSPTGTLTADRVQFNCTGTTFSDRSILFQTITSAVVGRSYTFSVYIKANAPSEVGKQLRFNVDSGTNPSQVITITADWTRYTFAAIAASTSMNVLLETRGTITTNTTADVLLWGAQLVEGTSALDYFPTTNRQDVPRIDFRNADGTLSSCGRLLLEPQRTNSIRNSSMVGAVAGSPGTLPTIWNQSGGGGLTTTISLGTESGLPYVDIRYNGTATQAFLELRFEANNGIAALNGQTWTMAQYIKAISGTIPTSAQQIIERNAASGFVATGSVGFVATSTLQRLTFTRTLAGGATVAFVQPLILFTLTVGVAYDFTIRIAAPQMELGGYATTWVPTTTAATTRLADAASKTGVSSLIGQTEGTLFAEVDLELNGDAAGILGILGTTGNFVYLFTAQTTNTLLANVFVSSVTQSSISYALPSAGRYKIALAYKANDFVLYVNGVQRGSDNSGSVPVCTDVTIPAQSAYAVYANSKHSQAALFPTRLTNAQLAQLTTL